MTTSLPKLAPTVLPTVAEKTETAQEHPWQVVVLNDPINLMEYVTMVLMTVLKLPKAQATKHMLAVHEQGESVVWTGAKEQAELYVQQLLGWKLNTQLRK